MAQPFHNPTARPLRFRENTRREFSPSAYALLRRGDIQDNSPWLTSVRAHALLSAG